MKQIRFTIPGPPKGKGRPRFSRANGHVMTYTPDSTANYEELVRWSWKSQCCVSFEAGVPLKVSIFGFFPIAKSISKKKHAELAGKPHTNKVDCDNLAKAVLDAMNHLAFYDDAQISDLYVAKRYSDNPRVEVRIEPMEENEHE